MDKLRTGWINLLLVVAGLILLGLSWLPVQRNIQTVRLKTDLQDWPSELRADLSGRQIEVDIPAWIWKGSRQDLFVRTNIGTQEKSAWNLVIEAQLVLPRSENSPFGVLSLPLVGEGWKDLAFEVSGTDQLDGSLWLHIITVWPESQRSTRSAVLAREISIPVREVIPGFAVVPMRWMAVILLSIGGLLFSLDKLKSGEKSSQKNTPQKVI